MWRSKYFHALKFSVGTFIQCCKIANKWAESFNRVRNIKCIINFSFLCVLQFVSERRDIKLTITIILQMIKRLVLILNSQVNIL